MKKFLLIIMLLLFCTYQSKYTVQSKEITKIKSDIHMTITTVDHSMTQEVVMNTNMNCNNSENIVKYHFFLNSFIAPIVGIKTEIKIVLTTKKIIDIFYCSSKIDDLESTRSNIVNVYLLHSIGKLGRT